MIYLIKTTETYRCDSEKEAQELIEESKKAGEYELTKYTNTTKEAKSKGEVEDVYQLVTLTKSFTDPKFPTSKTTVIYEGDMSDGEI